MIEDDKGNPLPAYPMAVNTANAAARLEALGVQRLDQDASQG